MRRGATRSLGLDVGDRHIGIALSDTIGILATPLTILERRDESKDIEAIVDIISQRQVKKIVIGLPYTMNGSIGQQAEKVLAFVEKLNIKTKVPVILRDERCAHLRESLVLPLLDMRAFSHVKIHNLAFVHGIIQTVSLHGLLLWTRPVPCFSVLPPSPDGRSNNALSN